MKHSNYFVKSDLSPPSPEMGGVLSHPERRGKKMESGRFFRGYTHEEMFRMTTIF